MFEYLLNQEQIKLNGIKNIGKIKISRKLVIMNMIQKNQRQHMKKYLNNYINHNDLPT